MFYGNLRIKALNRKEPKALIASGRPLRGLDILYVLAVQGLATDAIHHSVTRLAGRTTGFMRVTIFSDASHFVRN